MSQSHSDPNALVPSDSKDLVTEVKKENDDDDDDTPQLNAHTLAALQEFYAEQEALRELLERSTVSEDPNNEITTGEGTVKQLGSAKTELFSNDLNKTFPEDWQLSQFWYDEQTSKTLANEVLRQAGNGKVACVSCPSIFRACENADNVHLFEYDRRFQAFGSLFHFYDYSDPENIPEACIAAFSVVIADPPFLAEECLEKVAVTIKKLLQEGGKVILCTGAVMEPNAERLLNLKRTSFVPHHKNNLGNEFGCFANYDMQINVSEQAS